MWPLITTTKQWFGQSSLFTKALSLLGIIMLMISLTVKADEEEFLSPEEAFKYELIAEDDGSLSLNWTIAPDYYLYRKRMQVTATDDADIQVNYPDGDTIHDEYFGESEVYYNQAIVKIDANNASSLQIRWQGCAAAGLCYPPQSAVIDLNDIVNNGMSQSINANGGQTSEGNKSSLASTLMTNNTVNGNLANQRTKSVESPAEQTSTQSQNLQIQANNNATTSTATSVALAEDQRLAGQLASSSLLLNLLVFFGLGLLLSFTPCVLPMIPILTSVIVGAQVQKTRAFTLSLAFVLAMAVTYAVIGVVAALAGSSLQATLQQPAFIVPLVIIFVLLALSMFGLYELQLPLFIRQRLNKLNNNSKGGSIVGASAMGVVSALLASPCMTAPLAGALIYIADTGNVVYGGLTLLVLGLGMGAPLILMATVGSALLPKPGMWMNQVKALFGFILLGTAIWFLSRLVASYIHIGLWGAWMLALGASIFISRYTLAQRKAWDNILLVSSMIIAFWGMIMMIGAAGGAKSFTKPLASFGGGRSESTQSAQVNELAFIPLNSYSELESNLAQAKTQGKWTLVDFYADWCVSCKVIESKVFTDPMVAAQMQQMTLLRADITDYDTDDKALMSALSVIAPPAILIFDPQGNEVRSKRVVGELTAKEFLQHLPNQ